MRYDIDSICDEIDDLEEQIRQLKYRLEELYEIRQEYWEEERLEAIREYKRSVI